MWKPVGGGKGGREDTKRQVVQENQRITGHEQYRNRQSEVKTTLVKEEKTNCHFDDDFARFQDMHNFQQTNLE